MIRGKRAVSILLGIMLLGGTVGCSPADSGTTTAQSKQSSEWVDKQMAIRQQSIVHWKKAVADRNQTAAERTIAAFAVNALSSDMKPFIEAKNKDRQVLLHSLAGKKTPTASNGLPALSNLTVETVNQLDRGRVMYTITGTIFTSVPDKLYPVTIQVRVDKSGEIESFNIQ